MMLDDLPDRDDLISEMVFIPSDSPCEDCVRCDCFLCPLFNPDVYLGQKDCFGDEIS